MKLTTRRSQTLDGEVKLEIASPARYGGSRALKFFHLQAKKNTKSAFFAFFLEHFCPFRTWFRSASNYLDTGMRDLG